MDSQSRFGFGATRWSLVERGQMPDGDAARNELLERYHEAIYRYLLARLADPHAADEVHSLFVERLLANDPILRRADQEKGRFRHYLRRVLANMATDYHRRRARDEKKRAPFDEANVGAAPEGAAADDAFRREWVAELMKHAWKALEETSRAKGQLHYDLLLHKAQTPDARSRQIAEHFSAVLGKPLTEANVRQILHRAMETLSDLFVQEVARSLEGQAEAVDADLIEQELIDLEMFDQPRRDALERRRRKS